MAYALPLCRDSVESLVITHPNECVIFSVLEKLKNFINDAQILDLGHLAWHLLAS